MNWRDVLAATVGQTPVNGWEWPSAVGGRFGVRSPAYPCHACATPHRLCIPTPTPCCDACLHGGAMRHRAVAFYVCPDHIATGGYESCCACGGWTEDDPDRGRMCSEATDD